MPKRPKGPVPRISPEQLSDETFIRQRQVLEWLPLSATTLWREVKAGAFPAPINLSSGGKLPAWRVGALRAWLKAKERA